MKVSDKIYIPFYPNDDGIDTHLGDDWFDNKDIDQYVEGWKEYINKDALLEWLEYEKEWFEGTDIEPHYQKMIDKLNSIK